MVEGNGLENRRWATIREFESHLLRQILKTPEKSGVFFRLSFITDSALDNSSALIYLYT